MASFVALTVIFGFNAVLCCIQLLRGGADTMTTMAQEASQSGLALVRLAAASLVVPAVMATMTLTPLLAFAHVRELVVVRAAKDGNGNGGGGGGGGAGPRLVAGLAKATLVAATTALLAAAVVQLGADGHLDRGRGDVARLNIK